MKIARILCDGEIRYARVDGEDLQVLAGNPLEKAGETCPDVPQRVPISEAHLLTPVCPTKIIGVAKNYALHAREMGSPVPREPMLFFKTPNTLNAPGDPIVLPSWSHEVHYEGELAVVIGTRAKDVSAADAWRYVAGYTCANDVSARDAQAGDGQWARAKGFDTACPLGPWLVTADAVDPSRLTVRTTLNGRVVQEGNTADMIVGVADLIAYASAAFTLSPGDVILTGTPAGVGPLAPGDIVEVTVSSIGTLRSPVRR